LTKPLTKEGICLIIVEDWFSIQTSLNGAEMNSTTVIERLMRQTRAYEYADGLYEITMGLLFVLVGLAIYALPGSSPEVGAIGAVIVGAVIVASQWAITQIRLRLTWQRTGYAKFERTGYRRFQMAKVVLGFAAAIAVNALFILVTGRATWHALMLAICVLVYFVAEWKRFGQTRWLVLASSAMLVAFAVTLLPLTRQVAFFAMTSYVVLVGKFSFEHGVCDAAACGGSGQ
jgi:hypothetical protein